MKIFFIEHLQESASVNLPFKCQPHKMVKHTQIIRQLIANELFEGVWPFCGIAS